MFKLLIITNRFVIGGPAFHVSEIACRLQNDFDILIVGGEAAKGEVNNLQMFNGLKNEPIVLTDFSRNLNFFGDLRSYFKIKRIIKEFRPDIVHTHTAKPGFFGRWAAFRAKVPIVVHTFHGHLFYGYFGNLQNKLLIEIERFMAKRTHSIIALSALQKKDLVEVFKISDDKKITIIEPGIEKANFKVKEKTRAKFREKYSISNDCLLLGAVGRLVKIKNLELFIRGIKYLKSNDIKVKGIIVGDGPQKRDLKDFCLTQGLTFAEFSVGNQNEDIIFTSWHNDVAKVYAGLDGIVLTSKNEGTPYSLIEAQIMGVPVIAAKVGGVQDVVDEGNSALLFESDNEFFLHLDQYSSDEQLRFSMSLKAKKWAAERFSSDTMSIKIRNLYLNLIQTKASS